jgi:O-antigen/teichoic acid export membrane protein
MSSLARNTILLTATGMVEFSLQILTPIILVRSLDAVTFGEYRLLWLCASTALALAPAFMPQSLFYFLPRVSQGEQGLYIGNVLAYLAIAGLAVSLLTSSWNPFLPVNMEKLFADSKGMSSVFLGCWIIVSLMTILPTAEDRVGWQMRNDILLSLFRTILLVAAALLIRELIALIAALVIEACVRLGTLSIYMRTRVGSAIRVGWASMKQQIRYAIPFAFGSALFQLRGVADQWIIAGLLSPSSFAIFSISGIFLSLTALVRQPLINALIPRLSKAFALNQPDEFIRLFRTSSGALTLIMVTVAGGLLCVTKELVQIVYTDRYLEAVPIMQVYMLNIMLQGFAAGYVLPILNRGHSAIANNASCLCLSIVLSYLGMHAYGLTGAACGSLSAFIIGESWSLFIFARTFGVKLLSLLPWLVFIRTFTASCMGLSVVLLSSADSISGPFYRLVLKSGIFVAVFFVALHALGGRAQLRILLKNVSNGLTKNSMTKSALGESTN